MRYCKCGHSFILHKTKLLFFRGEGCKICKDCNFYASRKMTHKQVLIDISLMSGILYGMVGALLGLGVFQNSPIEIGIGIVFGGIMVIPLRDLIKSKLRYFDESKPIVEDSLT